MTNIHWSFSVREDFTLRMLATQPLVLLVSYSLRICPTSCMICPLVKQIIPVVPRSQNFCFLGDIQELQKNNSLHTYQLSFLFRGGMSHQICWSIERVYQKHKLIFYFSSSGFKNSHICIGSPVYCVNIL